MLINDIKQSSASSVPQRKLAGTLWFHKKTAVMAIGQKSDLLLAFLGTDLMTESFSGLGAVRVFNKYWNNLVKTPFNWVFKDMCLWSVWAGGLFWLHTVTHRHHTVKSTVINI